MARRVRFDRLDPAPFCIDIGTTENLVLNMNGGDDKFSATGNLSALIKLTVDGGTGNDTILGGNGADTLLGGDGNDFIDGNQGNDTAFLGAGDDTFQWDPGDGSDTVEGQAGIDTMLFNGSAANEKIDVPANGGRVLLHRDIANITMDLNDVEHVDINALGGADSIVVNDLTAPTSSRSISASPARSAARPATAQIDTVTVNGSNAGNTINVTGAGQAPSPSRVCAALVQHHRIRRPRDKLVDQRPRRQRHDHRRDARCSQRIKLTIDGGAGNDTIIGGRGADNLIGGDGNDFIDGQQRQRLRAARRRQRHGPVGSGRRQRHRSKVGPAPTRCCSTAPTSPRTSTFSPMAGAAILPVTWRRSPWT